MLTTVASVVYDVDIQAGRTTRTGAPGGQASYWLRATNQGNDPDTFDLTVEDNVWSVTAPIAVGLMTAGAYEDIDVVVSIPANALPGESDLFTVTVVSQGDPAQSAGVALRTTTTAITIQPHYVYLPLILRTLTP